MKAEELMVGDYLTFSDFQNVSNCPKLKVVAINEEDVYLSIDGDPIAAWCDPEELSGIPITPEILEKNGFEKLGFDGWEFDYVSEVGCLIYEVLWRCDYPKEYHTHLTIKSYSPDFGSFKSFRIDSVHELQHALRICGIDKTIEL